MSDQEKKAIELAVAEALKDQEFNKLRIRVGKVLRLLEQLNRDNCNEHKVFVEHIEAYQQDQDMILDKISKIKQSLSNTEEAIEMKTKELSEQVSKINIWDLFVEQLRKKPAILIGIIAAPNVHIIFESVVKLFQLITGNLPDP